METVFQNIKPAYSVTIEGKSGGRRLIFVCLKRGNIGNRMVCHAIWEKHARVSFSKTIKIARVRRTSAI
jgi:hypothetical protein